jgi:hypothetical protein
MKLKMQKKQQLRYYYIIAMDLTDYPELQAGDIQSLIPEI